MVTIPPSLQPPAKALTVAQSKALSSPQTPKPTTQAVKSLTEKEYYAQQGKIILGKLQTEIQRIEVKVASARAKYNRTGTDSASEKLEKVEEQRDALKSLTAKAATGKYTYNSLANYAYDYANYRLGKAKEVRAKLVEQKVVMEDIPQEVIAIEQEPATAVTPQPGQPLYAPLESITGYTGGTATAYTAPTGGTPVYIKPTVKHTGYIPLPSRPEPVTTFKDEEPSMGLYSKVDKALGGVLPGGVPYKKEEKQVYAGVQYSSSRTRAVEVGTGKIAVEQGKDKSGRYKMNTQTANLEDHYFIKTQSGEWIDMGVYNPALEKRKTISRDVITGATIFGMGGDIKTTPEETLSQKTYTYIPLEDVGPVTPGVQPLKIDTTNLFGIKELGPTKDKSLIASQIYGGGQGTLSYRPTTVKGKKAFEKAEEYGSIGGLLNLYKEKVVEPLAYEGKVGGIKVVPGFDKEGKFKMGQPIAGTYTKENLGNLFQYFEQEIVEPISEKGLVIGIDKEGIVRRTAPLGGIGGAPARGAVRAASFIYGAAKVGAEKYEEIIVEPIAPFIQRGDTPNPLTIVSRGKREIDVIAKESPEQIVFPIKVGSSVSDTTAGEYSKMGLFEFGTKRFAETVGVAWEEASMSRFIGADRTTAGYIGKGAEIATEFIPYAVPGYFETKVGVQMAEAQVGGGVFGGPSSAIGYAQERPLEVAMAAVMIYAHGVSGISKKLSKTDASKYQKYLTAKKVEVDSVNRVMKTKYPDTAPRYRPAIAEQVGPKGFHSAEAGMKLKGGTSYTYQVPTNSFKGTARELVQINGRNVFLKSNLHVVVKESGAIVRTFTYSDGTVKVITTKGTKITTELFSKTGGKLFGQTKDVPGFVDDMIKHKIKDVKIKASAERVPEYHIKVTKLKGTSKQHIELTDIVTGKKASVTSNSKLGKEILTKHGKGVKSIKLNIETMTDISRKTGVEGFSGQAVKTDTSMGDLIIASDKRGKLIVQSGKAKLKQETAFAQRIKYGVDTSKDSLFGFAEKGKAVKASVSSSITSRAMTSGYSQQITSYKISPSFKGSKEYADMFMTGKPIPKAVRGPNIIAVDWQPFNQPSIRETTRSVIDKTSLATKKTIAASKKASDAAKDFALQVKKQILKAGGTKKAAEEASKKALASFGRQPGVTYVAPPSTYIPTGPLSFSAPGVGPLGLAAKAPVDIVSPIVFSTFGFAGTLAGAEKSIVDVKSDQLFINIPEIKDDIKIDTSDDVILDFRVDQVEKTKQKIDNKIELVQLPVQINLPISEPVTDTPGPENILGDGSNKYKDKGLGIIDIDFGGRKRFVSKPVQAYQGQVLVKGKYQKVTDKPYTKRGARDFIARVIDNTISAQGKVTPLKKKVSSKKIKDGDGYYNQNQTKFRAFKLFAGQKIPIKDKIIEKKEYRLDKIGEQNKITVAQHMARSAKRAAGLPTRKKKSSSIFRL